jgi:hypothetical protein
MLPRTERGGFELRRRIVLRAAPPCRGPGFV